MNRIYTPYALAFLLILGSLLSLPYSLKAQVVWENPQSEVYSFLGRAAQKGLIEFDDTMLPISRKTIAEKLQELEEQRSTLNSVEQKELTFYQQEYSEFDATSPDSTYFLKEDHAGRLRFLTVKKDNFILRGDPAMLMGATHTGKGTSFITGTGIKFWGSIGKHIGFQAYFQDITESGKGLDSLKHFSPEPGIVKINTTNQKVLNYTDFRGSVSYNWVNGSVSFGMDKLLWGHGQHGRIVLSDKAPAYPFIRLDYKPLDWVSFNYSHLWLQSGILDTLKTYPKGNDIYGSDREKFIPKFMATHSLNFFPLRGLSVSIGESMVYSDGLDVGYLFPLMFFKVYDQHSGRNKINASSNAQFFLEINSRNHLRNTHVYTTLFIDEIRTTTIFDKAKSRNQLGYTLGASVTDLGIPYLTLGAEYTRINPFAYKNLIPAQTYTHQDYGLGDWMGDNSDRFLLFAKYTPIPRLKTMVQFQHIRKGSLTGLEDQYFAEPQPEFLANLERKGKQVLFKASYEWLNNLYFDAQYTWNKDHHVFTDQILTPQRLEFKIRLGL